MDFWERHKLRKAAKISLHHAKIVLHMNRDLLEPMVVGDLESAIANVRALRRRGSNEALREATTHVDRVAAYAQPKSKVSPLAREIVETLVVAFGVAMAFRAYFFQPFKIPTGSMQPTLYGIHSVAESDPENGPGLFDKQPLKPLKWIVTGEWYRDVVAESAGTVRVYYSKTAPGYIYVNVAGKRFKVPDDAVRRGELRIPNGRDVSQIGMADDMARGERTLFVGSVKKGDRVWAGYVTAGDQVFVNRMAWNFFPPKRDDVIVFTTSRAELEFGESSKQTAPFPFRVNDVPIPRLEPGLHYIKRLVGMPGETISIDYPNVLVDGEPVKGLPGIDAVAESKEQYPGGPRYAGYSGTLDPEMSNGSEHDFLSSSAVARTLGDEYLPIGDNTFNSFDGRYWGPVPRNQMVGPGAIVYWPISRRWGRIR